MKLKVYFATNRNKVSDRKGYYGKVVNPNGSDELRFGRVELDVPSKDLKKKGRTLRARIQRALDDEEGSVVTYDEHLQPGANHALGSLAMFEELKPHMDEGNDVLVYVHGYSVSFVDAIASGITLKYKFARAGRELQIVVFSWPSDGKKVPKRVYSRDQRDGRASGPAIARGFLKLRDFVKGIDDADLCNGKIHLMCHSMGNYVLKYAMGHLVSLGSSLPRIFTEVISVAADVDDDAFEHNHKLAQVSEVARRVSIYYNQEDAAMSLSENTKGNPTRLGHSGPRQPLLVPGRVFNIDASALVAGAIEHHYHLEEIITDAAQVLQGRRQDDVSDRSYQASSNTYFLTD